MILNTPDYPTLCPLRQPLGSLLVLTFTGRTLRQALSECLLCGLVNALMADFSTLDWALSLFAASFCRINRIKARDRLPDKSFNIGSVQPSV